MNQFFTSNRAEIWDAVDHTYEEHWDRVAPCTCVLVNTLSHYVWDLVNRYSLTYTDAEGQQRTANADDNDLNATYLSNDPHRVWVSFDVTYAT